MNYNAAAWVKRRDQKFPMPSHRNTAHERDESFASGKNEKVEINTMFDVGGV